MLIIAFTCAYLCGFCIILGMMPVRFEQRPTLSALGLTMAGVAPKKKKSLFSSVRFLAVINKPLCVGGFRKNLARELTMSKLNLSPEEFLLIQEIGIFVTLFLTFRSVGPGMVPGWIFMGLAVGYAGPKLWLRGRIKKIKAAIIKELPDAIDLLGLCVNAGLDFMLSLKWVVEKSRPSVMVDELNIVLQEINVGKTRRDAIKDLAGRYNLPDLSTFARTLVQADKMGTSVTDALNILSEDMRIARYRRGEQLALKSPLKMLVPLLVFIFPVVGILVAGPIVLDFIENNPFSQMAGRPSR